MNLYHRIKQHRSKEKIAQAQLVYFGHILNLNTVEQYQKKMSRYFFKLKLNNIKQN